MSMKGRKPSKNDTTSNVSGAWRPGPKSSVINSCVNNLMLV